MYVKDINGKEFAKVKETVRTKETIEMKSDSRMLELNKFKLINLLGLDIEIEFSETKKEVIKNVEFRAVEKSIESSSDNLKKTITFEARDIEK